MMAEQSLAISHNILPKLQKNGEISKCFRKKHGEFSFFCYYFPVPFGSWSIFMLIKWHKNAIERYKCMQSVLT